MKFTLAVITLTILLLRLTPSAWANPNPLLSSEFGPAIDDVLSSFVQEFDNIGEQLADSSLDGIESSLTNIDILSDFVENIDKFAKALSKSLQAQLEASFTNLLTIARQLRDSLPAYILEVSNQVRRRALQRANTALATYETDARNLQARIVQVREKMDTNIEDANTEILSSWQNWQKRQLAIVKRRTSNDDAVLTAANTETTAFIDRYTEYLESCGDELTAQVQIFESDVKEALDEHIELVESLGDEVNNCVEGTSTPVQQCVRYINAAIKELTSARNGLQVLNRRGVRLTTIRYKTSSCVVQTIRALETERLKIEKNLALLIENGVSEDSDDEDVETTTLNE